MERGELLTDSFLLVTETSLTSSLAPVFYAISQLTAVLSGRICHEFCAVVFAVLGHLWFR